MLGRNDSNDSIQTTLMIVFRNPLAVPLPGAVPVAGDFRASEANCRYIAARFLNPALLLPHGAAVYALSVCPLVRNYYSIESIMADEGIILRAFNASLVTYPAPPGSAAHEPVYAHYLAASGALQPAPPLDLAALPLGPAAAPLPALTVEDFFAGGAPAEDGLDEYERALLEMSADGEDAAVEAEDGLEKEEGDGGEEEGEEEGGEEEEEAVAQHEQVLIEGPLQRPAAKRKREEGSGSAGPHDAPPSP